MWWILRRSELLPEEGDPVREMKEGKMGIGERENRRESVIRNKTKMDIFVIRM